MEHRGIALINNGKATTSLSKSDITLSSATETMTLIKTMEDEFTVEAAPATNNTGTRTVYHNLGFFPLTVAYAQHRDAIWRQFPSSQSGFDVLPAGFYGSDSYYSLKVYEDRVTYDYVVEDYEPMMGSNPPFYPVVVRVKLFFYSVELGS